MAVVLFLNLKGGVAKTTNAVAIAECLADRGKSTLVIDADHQCTATELLLGEERMEKLEQRKKTLHDLFLAMSKPDFDSAKFASYVADKASNIHGGLEHLSVLPCSVRINELSSIIARRYNELGGEQLRSLIDRHRHQFQKWLNSHYDYTLIDCPPSLPLHVKQLLRMADGYVVPSQPNRLSIRGADWLCKKLHKDGFRKTPLGTLWSMCRGHDRQHQRMIASSTDGRFEGYEFPRPFRSTIPLTAPIAHAVDCDRPAAFSFRGKYGSEMAFVFDDLADELITRVEGNARHEDDPSARRALAGV